MKKILLILFIVGFTVAGCEKDDICDPATPTTPRMVIKFYNANNRSVLRAVTNLKIIGRDTTALPNESGVEFWNDTIAYIPLKVNEDITNYRFILNASNTSTIETDTIDFNYSRNDVYVSRACGFKTLFDLFGNPTEDPFVLNDTPNETTGNWIDDIEVVEPNINDENEAHIKIYF